MSISSLVRSLVLMQRSHTSRSQATGRRPAVRVRHATQREVPLAHAFVAQAQIDELQCTHKTRQLRRGAWRSAVLNGCGAAGSTVRPPSSSVASLP
jgi:hypothetical protein